MLWYTVIRMPTNSPHCSAILFRALIADTCFNYKIIVLSACRNLSLDLIRAIIQSLRSENYEFVGKRNEKMFHNPFFRETNEIGRYGDLLRATFPNRKDSQKKEKEKKKIVIAHLKIRKENRDANRSLHGQIQ